MTVETVAEPALYLNDIVQYELNCLFRQHHLNRDVVIGVIGERGDGKSLGGGCIALLDYMLEGETCWSNMSIAASFNINDDIAGKYHLGEDSSRLRGGIARYASQPLNKQKFLRFDPDYSGGVFFIDEINIWLADARRAMSDQNLYTNDVGQELRKLQSGLIYTCIHEMFVDKRIRDMTDIFIRTQDIALTPRGLARKQLPGKEFEWTIYPMSKKLNGTRFIDTRRPLPPVYFQKSDRFWGLIDTLERQRRRKYKGGNEEEALGEPMGNIQLGEDPEVVETQGQWGWLEPIAKELLAERDKYIPCSKVMNRDEVRRKKISQHILSYQLNNLYNICTVTQSKNGRRFRAYELPDEILTATTTNLEQE